MNFCKEFCQCCKEKLGAVLQYNKYILEYAEIVVTDSNSRILNIEGHSNIYCNKSHGAHCVNDRSGFIVIRNVQV